ncbi:MAG: hypothetical protein AAF211_06140 [Myxococcota bacterium]
MIAVAAPLLVACEGPTGDPEFEVGMILADLELSLVSDTVGVHPDRSIVFDENNPFRSGITVETKFAMLDDDGPGPIAGFYAFGTALIGEPTGENQFFTADQLRLIHERQLADPNDLALVRKLALAGYQQVLDEFTGAVTFDITGRVQFDLMPQAIQGILDLGGVPESGWRLGVGPDGELIAVQSGVTDD